MVHRSESELTLDNILFKERNKEYGAYQIRSLYNNYLRTATFIAIAMFALAFATPKIVKMFESDEVVEEEEFKITEVVLAEPPPIDPKVTPPPPPNVKNIQPPKISSVEFLPPKIMEDEKVIEEKEPPKQEDMVDANPGEKTVIVENSDNANLNEIIVSGDGTGNAEVADVEPVAVFVGEPSVFQGDYLKFLRKNLKYSSEALSKKIQGKVHLKFVIEKDGTISDVIIVKGLGFGLDDEAIRVVKLMNKQWTVGKNNGVAVRSWKNLAIDFRYKE